jgi:exosortase A
MADTTTRTAWRDSSAAPHAKRLPSRLGALASGRLAIAAGLLLTTVLVYWPSAVALDAQWRDIVDHTYTHGYLVLAISLWLVWRDRAKLDAAPLHPVSLALPALLLFSAAWLFFWRAAIQDAHLLLLPVLLATALLAVLGWAAVRVLLFPLGFLYFAMPAWSDLVDPLQHLSADANGLLIWLTGLPAYMDGNIVHLPAGTLEIAEGCSGMHFLIVGLALAALYGEVTRDAPRHRLLWLGIMGVFALAANWLRIFVIIVAAYATDMRTFLVAHHYWFGWLVFAGSFALFLWIAGRWVPEPATPASESEVSSPPDAGADAPTRPSLGRCAAALICLAVLPLTVYAVDSSRGSPAPGIAIAWPAGAGSWNGPQPVVSSDWMPHFQNPTADSRRQYVGADGQPVDFFVVAYRTQHQGAKLVAYGNSLLGQRGLRILEERTVEAAGGKWRQMRIAGRDGTESLLWSQYRIGGRRFVAPRVSQLWYGVAAFITQPVSSLLAVRTACEPSCNAAAARLAAAAKLQPSLSLAAPGGD